MSRQLTNLLEPKIHNANLRDFTYSVDIKKFSRDRGNMTPMHQNSNSFYKKVQNRSNEKIRNSQPTSLAITFSKHISQKNMPTKRKLSSGCKFVAIASSGEQNLDLHLLKEKYNTIRELFEAQKYDKVIPMIKHIILHFQYSNAQKNLYYWLTISLMQSHRYEDAIEQITECLAIYPTFQEGHLCLAHLNLKQKNYKIAVEHFLQSIKINNKNHIPYLQLSLCYQQMKEHQKCVSLIKSIIDRFSKQGQFLMMLIESLIELNELDQCDKFIQKSEQNFNRKDSLFLYIRGVVQKQKGNQNQAYILFEQALKYNNNRQGVSKSLLQTIKIQINKRDFYKAHHSISRRKFLQLQQTQQMQIYSILIEGVMTMMKKKSQQAIQILNQIVGNRKCQQMRIQSLVYKYMGYGYFKISEYGKSIKFYQKIISNEIDQSSHYNKLLAEGIQLADKQNNFNEAINKFNHAKIVYPQKVQPYVYIAMVHILRFNVKKDNDQVKKAEVLIEALKQLQIGYRLNPNSSNLLYHRTIIHLYFQDWEQAHNDINRCIQKAQENLPKYFYLRGVCYSCVKDYKKSINQYSICLSLDISFTEAYLQKAKCHFLLGNTEKGFSSLKVFMQMNPDDLSIYKWIGDLLYEGMSYKDALKAYNQLGDIQDIETNIMKMKCSFRVSTLHEISSLMKNIQKLKNIDKDKFGLDLSAFQLLHALLKHEGVKSLNILIKKMNKYLEQNIVGYIFQLIDCMNLLGVASFYTQKYSDAYESFLLVLQLYQSLSEKQTVSLKSQSCDEQLDLRSQDIYFNIIICQFAQGNTKQAIRMINEEYISIISDNKKRKFVEKIAKILEKNQSQICEWDFKSDKPINNKLKKIELLQGKLKLKTKPAFNFYHDSATNLYASSVAQKMINQLHAGYIDNMPEGPWIKRNPYGVIFTEEVVPSDNSISFEDSSRQTQSKVHLSMQSDEPQHSQEEKKTISKKQQFLKKLKFDQAVQTKLNNMIMKSQAEGMKKKQN